MGENVGGKLIVTISVDPLQQELVGTQFNLNYDNTALKFEKVEFTTKGNPMNYGTNKDNYINLGSLITDGSTTLDKTTEYKVTFLPVIGLNGTLGLTSVSTTDAVNKNGIQLKSKSLDDVIEIMDAIIQITCSGHVNFEANTKNITIQYDKKMKKWDIWILYIL